MQGWPHHGAQILRLRCFWKQGNNECTATEGTGGFCLGPKWQWTVGYRTVKCARRDGTPTRGVREHK